MLWKCMHVIFCTLAMPSPSSIITAITSSNQVYIKWNNTNFENFYIDCLYCPLIYKEKFPIKTTSDKVNITDLGLFAMYNLEVRFENDITKLFGRTSKQNVSVKTRKGSNLGRLCLASN